MRDLFLAILIILLIPILFVNAQSADTGSSIDNRVKRIQTLLREQGISLNGGDFIFYCTGDHGIIWSLIESDSSGIHMYNGTTRKHIDYENQNIPDTLSFIDDNIKTIRWGLDSLADDARLLSPLKRDGYNPIYNELYILNDGHLSFHNNDAVEYYSGDDSKEFSAKLGKLNFLMLWLAAPSLRQYIPHPNDTLLLTN